MSRKKNSNDPFEPGRVPVLEAIDESKGKKSSPKKKKKKAPRKRKHTGKSRQGVAGKWDDVKFHLWQFFKRLILPVMAVVLLLVGWFFLTQPDIGELNTATRKPSVVVKAEDGKIVGSYGEIYADFVPYDDLPQSLIDAVLATEDRNFFTHFGIDPLGIARALYVNMRAGKTVQGGSTITQQVAKNIFLTPERSIMRKLREAALAFRLESRYTKEEILAIYMNRVYLGAGNYGVDAAARRYFNKSARKINLSESVIIAGLLKAPSRFAPTNNPELTEKRAAQVLKNMVEADYLKEENATKARERLASTIESIERNSADDTYYFTDWIMDQLPDLVGNVSEDLVVNSTLSVSDQKLAENAVKKLMDAEGAKNDASQAALVSMSPDGAVRAMMGGRSYGTSPFNRATQAKRQPGSAFKTFVYLAALEAGYDPGSTVLDQPITVNGWTPRNYNGKYEGAMSLSSAVARSINSVAVQLSERVGRNRVIAMARRLGIESKLEAISSIALGSNEVSLLELTGAYAHLANYGQHMRPYGIVSVQTASGKLLYRHPYTRKGAALNGNVVGMMNRMLSGVIQWGTGRRADIGRHAAGKTGTTSDYRDAWFIGYTPQLVTGVWVGNDNNKPMKKVTGGTLPAPIWSEYMKAAHQGKEERYLPTASGHAPRSVPWGSSPSSTEPAVTTRPTQVPGDASRPPRFQLEPAPNRPILDLPENRPAPVRQPPPPQERDGGYELNNSFWDKLLGPGSVEHTYPEQNPR